MCIRDSDASTGEQTIRAIYQGENGGIVFITSPGIPATGSNSQEDLTIEIGGFEIALKDMVRTAVTVNTIPSIQYRIVDTTTRITRTIGSTFEFNIRGPLETKVDRLASDATPLAEGTAAPGTSKKLSRDDHIHPASSAGLDQNAVDARVTAGVVMCG